jgi:beta-glucosidase
MNEISTFAWIGYGVGTHAPGRCSPGFGSWCQSVGGGGNSGTEPYIAAHNALLAHGLAVQTYRNKYQKKHGGKIGMTINSGYALPFNTSVQDDVNAVNTAVAFGFGWFADPIVFGKYPDEMTSVITGGRLPTFNASASALMKGSFDFLGLNYYSSNYVKYTGETGSNYGDDSRVQGSPSNASGHVIGPRAESTWLYVYPEGLRSILTWIKKRYSNPHVYIFENGCSCPDETQTPLPQVLNDTFRVDYVYNHVMNVLDSIVDDGVNVKGYFLWSLMDNFEWADGFNVRFGITYVDYNNNLTRYPKQSYYLYQSLINYLGSSHYSRFTMPSAQDLIRRIRLIDQ